MGFEPNSLAENRLKTILLAVGTLLIFATAFGAWCYSKSGSFDDAEKEAPPILNVERDIERGEDITYPTAQELAGKVVMIGPKNSYVRLAVGDIVYSIGLTAETKVTQEGQAFDIATLDPRTEILVTALELPNTEQFDFLARSIEIPASIVLTVEERIEELSKKGMNESANF